MLNETLSWNNYENQAFYDVLPVETFRSFAKLGGLEACPDLKFIQSYIDSAHSIIELGAGFGRVLDYLLSDQFKGTITAIERCPKLYEFLKEKYQHTNVTVLLKDAHHLGKIEKADLILWMWSGIADFTPDEQFCVLRQLKNLLSDQGFLIVDTISPNKTPIGMEKEGNVSVFVQKYEDAMIHTYSLSNEEIDQYAKELGFEVKHYDYTTTTGRVRSLHIFSKILV